MFFEKPEIKVMKLSCEDIMSASSITDTTEELDDPIELPDIDA